MRRSQICDYNSGRQLFPIFLYFPIFWIKILYFEKPPIFPIFSYILKNIPIFFRKCVAGKKKRSIYCFDNTFGICILQVQESFVFHSSTILQIMQKSNAFLHLYGHLIRQFNKTQIYLGVHLDAIAAGRSF